MFPVIGGAAGAFDPLPPVACLAAGITESCVGFTTREGRETTFELGFIITGQTVTIPEAESFLFLLAGLVGVGIRQAYSRRRVLEATA